VHGDAEILCRALRIRHARIDPALPATPGVNEHELGVVEPDAHDDGFDTGTLSRAEIRGTVKGRLGFALAFERPRPSHV
jgi:hypothetical protein